MFLFHLLVFLSVCLSVNVCQSLCVSLSFCWSDFPSVSNCQSVFLSVFLFCQFFCLVSLSFCQAVFLSVSFCHICQSLPQFFSLFLLFIKLIRIQSHEELSVIHRRPYMRSRSINSPASAV